MTPAARVQAAIGILDRIAAGEAAEKALLGWARGARYAGSKDRAAVRDHVFDAVRRWRSTAVLGGAETGRARMLGLLRQQGIDPDTLFSGAGHGPAPLTQAERAAGRDPAGAEAADLPDWLWQKVVADWADKAETVADAFRSRAETFLRVNTLRGDLDEALRALAEEGIGVEPAPRARFALRVTGNTRALARSEAYASGLVELQDASSQAVVEALPLHPGMTVLDQCAGGGGKALAMAARLNGGPVDAHDADPARMADLPGRAARAGADIRMVADPRGPYDLVLTDVPCSGSGAWRRAPEGKWRLTPDRFTELGIIQASILDAASGLVGRGGALAYATCSIFAAENRDQIDRFQARNPGWRLETERLFPPDQDGDGFYLAVLRR
ncbi:RsmB/NOP family class I SAM-dependent RNA methyltransferase [Thalassococcus sp. CAU 1522]|uniref:RsmB/NOP family class I SAM-dependent RNA methyltransferase n=1 Tax=Thalassococcus arenae TaxID=2851652 RepID=A0ABS6NB12_9RHOB|nr:RsmB/NOP family class I SAM-dependent RNA methyltransferase [Thalassococcus arenae]MBV2360774.1 RsmB/NOP family class I SAM-dependent RNA methyltransferase [Thalassococcus arenae]